MLKLTFFVPESHLESVKQAVFDAGAGKIGNYDNCSWQCLGQGQFRPLSGADPFLGEPGVLSLVSEYRVELVCDEGTMSNVVRALRNAHPYEEPAFDVTRVLDF
jgi:hypothetical protein